MDTESLWRKASIIPRSRPRYVAGFREQLVELVQAGCSPEELAGEFEPSAQTIRN